MRQASLLITLVVGCVASGALSGWLAGFDAAWYAALAKPRWTPPVWLFAPVWTLLYASMGVALYLVLQKGWRAGGVRWAVALFVGQFLINLAWSPVFFGLHSIGGALLIILAMWLMIGWTIAALWSVRDVAGIVLVPYWLWVTFAVALNAAIWRMN